ncbi:hypothetical protein ACFPU0_12350 [Pseudomonas sp. GCM10022186]|uniref:hypothetical protein n=1 Tax=Pseudomonas sp. GCM10022186 TaxID=3252650 RepID=UPI003613D1C7
MRLASLFLALLLLGGCAARQVKLAAASALLQPGDELGLETSGFSGQYLFNSSWNPRETTPRGGSAFPRCCPLDAPLASQ